MNPLGRNQLFSHMGEQRYMKQLAAESGIPIHTLYQRYWRGDRDARLVRPLTTYGTTEEAVAWATPS